MIVFLLMIFLVFLARLSAMGLAACPLTLA
jgi:hypothetical protein